jgi:hypothetical protein
LRRARNNAILRQRNDYGFAQAREACATGSLKRTARRNLSTMTPTLSTIGLAHRLGAALVALALCACASSESRSDFNAFLQTIANDCKPLIIGNDNIGEAIVFNGLGAVPENYNNFLSKTASLYRGAIPERIYRDSLTAFLGPGSYNERSLGCIIAHLPSAPPVPPR